MEGFDGPVSARTESLTRVVLTLEKAGVEFLDSAGLGLLMILYGTMKTHSGQLRLVAPTERVLGLLKLTCTDAILPIDQTLEATLAA